MSADRHLLFGLLALQNEFIDKRQLVAAFGAWIADRGKSLDRILVEQASITEDLRQLLEKLVDKHVQARGGNLSKSLNAISGDSSVRIELERLADTDLQASIVQLKPIDAGVNVTVGQSTSEGRRFEIRRPLDRGGLGIVSVAMDKEFNREVALKEIRFDRANDPRFRQKFLKEAEVTGGLEHPNIVPVYGLGTYSDGRPYYAMRLVHGDNLREHIRLFHREFRKRHSLFVGSALRKLLRRFLDVCEAIDYAHARGILHRDLKPGNVMLGKYGETLVVDWGLAKSIPPNDEQLSNADPLNTLPYKEEIPLVLNDSEEDETQQGAVVGTAAYAPPEQLLGNIHEVGIRSDVYGLGAILYELLTGQAPGIGNTLDETIRNVVQGKIIDPRSLVIQVPKPLEAICIKALSLSQENRYSSAAELGLEIERWLDDQAVLAYPEPALVRTGRWIRSNQTLVATAAVMVLMTTIGLGLFSSVVSQNNFRLASLNNSLDIKNNQLKNSFERELAFSSELETKRNELEGERLELFLHTGYLDCENGRVEIGLSKMAKALRMAAATTNSKIESRIRRLIAAWSFDHMFSFPIASKSTPQNDSQRRPEDMLSFEANLNAISADGKLVACLDDQISTAPCKIQLFGLAENRSIDLLSEWSITMLRSNLVFSKTGGTLAFADNESLKFVQLSDRSVRSIPLPLELQGGVDNPIFLQFRRTGDRLIAVSNISVQEFVAEQATWTSLSNDRLNWGQPIAVAISDGTPLRIAVSSADSGVHVFEHTNENNVVKKISDRMAFTLDFNSDGSQLSAGGISQEVGKSPIDNGWYCTWKLDESVKVESDGTTIGGVSLVRFLPDRSSLLLASGNHVLLKSPNQLQKVSVTGDGFKRSLIPQSANASIVAAGSGTVERGRFGSLLISDKDGIRLWNIGVRTPLLAQGKLRGNATCATFDADGETIFVGLNPYSSEEPSIEWRNAIDLKTKKAFSTESFGRVNAISLAKLQNRLFWTGDKTGVCSLDDARTQIYPTGWSSTQRKSMAIINDGNDMAVAVEQESGWFLVNTTVGSVWFINTSNGSNRRMTLSIPDTLIQSVAAGPSDELLTGASDYTVRHWNPKTGKEIGNIERYLAPVVKVFANDASPVYGVATADGALHIKRWESKSGTELVLQHTSRIESACISLDGSIVATGCANGVAQLWDASTGERIGKGFSHPTEVHAIAISPDTRLLFTGAGDLGQVWEIPHAGAEPFDELANRTEWLTGLTINESGEPITLTTQERLQRIPIARATTANQAIWPAIPTDNQANKE